MDAGGKSDGSSEAAVGKSPKTIGSPQDLERVTRIVDHFPTGFATMTPWDAAFALVETNRTLKHHRLYALSTEEYAKLDYWRSSFLSDFRPSGGDFGDANIPAEGAILYDHSANHWEYTYRTFIRWDRQRSYMFHVLKSRNMLDESHSCKVGTVEVSYERAKRLAEILWWLARIRTDKRMPRFDSGGSGGSSSDDRVAIRILGPGGRSIVEADGSMWDWADISQRWHGRYDESVFMNLANLAITDFLATDYHRTEPEIGRYDAPMRISERTDKATAQQVEWFYDHALRAFELFDGDHL